MCLDKESLSLRRASPARAGGCPCLPMFAHLNSPEGSLDAEQRETEEAKTSRLTATYQRALQALQHNDNTQAQGARHEALSARQ